VFDIDGIVQLNIEFSLCNFVYALCILCDSYLCCSTKVTKKPQRTTKCFSKL